MESLRERLGDLNRRGDISFDVIEKIRGEYNHSIQLVEPRPLIGRLNFNCVMYALNLRADELYIAIAGSDSIIRASHSRSNELSISADTEFLEFCVHDGPMRSVSSLDGLSHDLLIYANDVEFRHIGKVVEHGRICSKWGLNDLLEHEPLEVMDDYGNDLQYFEGLTCEQARELFIKYAWTVVDSDERIQEHLKHTIDKYR